MGDIAEAHATRDWSLKRPLERQRTRDNVPRDLTARPAAAERRAAHTRRRPASADARLVRLAPALAADEYSRVVGPLAPAVVRPRRHLSVGCRVAVRPQDVCVRGDRLKRPYLKHLTRSRNPMCSFCFIDVSIHQYSPTYSINLLRILLLA